MREFHQGQRSMKPLKRPDIWKQYSFCRERIFLAIRGRPYMTPCRMALHFDYASANATTSSKRPTATATRGSSYTAPLALRFLYSFAERSYNAILFLSFPVHTLHETGAADSFTTPFLTWFRAGLRRKQYRPLLRMVIIGQCTAIL